MIIATGSTGNAILIDKMLIDAGVSFNKIEPYINEFDYLFVTHKHGDHLNPKTIKRIAESGKKVYCNTSCSEVLKTFKIPHTEFNAGDILTLKNKKGDAYEIESFNLTHNVPNNGFKIKITDMFDDVTRCIYATDTQHMKGITAKNYDYFFIEGNYDEEKIEQLVLGNAPWENGTDSKNRHLSTNQMKNFFIKNKHKKSKLIQLHSSTRFS